MCTLEFSGYNLIPIHIYWGHYVYPISQRSYILRQLDRSLHSSNTLGGVPFGKFWIRVVCSSTFGQEKNYQWKKDKLRQMYIQK